MNFIVENYKTIPYGYVIDTCSKSHGNTISTFLISLWDFLWILIFGKIPKWHNFRMRFLITDHSVVTLNGTPWGNCNIWWSTFGHASMKNTTMRSSNSQSIWRKVSGIACPHFCCTLSHILQDHPLCSKPKSTIIIKKNRMGNICLFFSSRSLKTREKYISFAQFVYFLREVHFLFNFWMIKFTIMFFLDICNCEFYHSKIEK